LLKENPLKMSELLKNKYFLNEKSAKELPKSLKNSTTDLAKFRFLIKSPKKAFIFHKKKLIYLAKTNFTVKSSKKVSFSIKLRISQSQLTEISFSVKSPKKE
jgi:hypothetical protein